MKRSVTTVTIATLGAAAFALTLGIDLANADSGKSAKVSGNTSSHSYGQHGSHGNRGYGGHGGHHDGYKGHSGGHSNGHNKGHHNYRPQYGGHRTYGHGGHHTPQRGYGYPSYARHGYAKHNGYYCSHCHYRTSSYSIFYSHVFHHHQVPWYDIGALIVFDPVKLFFTFGGHGNYSPAHH